MTGVSLQHRAKKKTNPGCMRADVGTGAYKWRICIEVHVKELSALRSGLQGKTSTPVETTETKQTENIEKSQSIRPGRKKIARRKESRNGRIGVSLCQGERTERNE